MDEIETLIRRLPKLRVSRKAIASEEAEALIADDDELFNAVALYTARDPDVFMTSADVLERLIEILLRIKPFRPWFGVFYRGQKSDCLPGPMGFRSWTSNRSIAGEFARDYGRDGVICVLARPVKAVSIEGIETWRMRLRDESQYPGMQAEWLILDR